MRAESEIARAASGPLRGVSLECRARAPRADPPSLRGLAFRGVLEGAVESAPLEGAVASVLVAGAVASALADAVRRGGFTVRRGAAITCRSPVASGPPSSTVVAVLKPRRAAMNRAWGMVSNLAYRLTPEGLGAIDDTWR